MYEIYIGLGPLIQNMYLEVSCDPPYMRAGALDSENYKTTRTDWRFWPRFPASGGHGNLSRRGSRRSVARKSTQRSPFFHARTLKKFERPQKRYKHKLEISQNRGQIWNINLIWPTLSYKIEIRGALGTSLWCSKKAKTDRASRNSFGCSGFGSKKIYLDKEK